MIKDEEILRLITNDTKSSISEFDIVTPELYASIFSKHALEKKFSIENNLDISNQVIEDKMSALVNIQNKTSENATKLSNSTNKAISAIEKKDDKTLSEVLKETQKLREELENLKESIYIDELTNSYNRKWLNDSMLKDNGDDFKDSGTVAIIDLNYFKNINDTYGHTIGDKVLIFIAKELKKTKESVVRYGGDEFIVIFSNDIKKNDALATLNSIRENVLKKNMKLKDSSFKVSFAFGVQEFKSGDSMNSTIEKADKNMYKDKKNIKRRITGI